MAYYMRGRELVHAGVDISKKRMDGAAMDNQISFAFDEENSTASVDIRNSDENYIDIPDYVSKNGDNYVVNNIHGIGDKSILISKYLRNKFAGPNIFYKETLPPPALSFSITSTPLQELEKHIGTPYFDICQIIRKKDQYNALSHFSKLMGFDKDEELMECCRTYIDKPNGFDFTVCETIGCTEVLEKIINPNRSYLKNVYNQCVEHDTLKLEFNIFFFALYCEYSSSLFSSEYWDKNLPDLYIFAFSRMRDAQEANSRAISTGD